ncbi:protein ORF63 [Anguillid herpesvirus 1]|uniref:Protein ORF63 n=1 Tax=Anguillid herpesvirus 1 TaxID=150286 RepID=A0A1J0REZ5_9VIRU|nr:protein ORF63 [Anguillid herpesvirus 1]ADA57826.1 protein ORF63 [Anguillid herpesvirus 1]APD76226.1 ORF63 [Anguillid herpesvirus 1]QRM16357.1 protein ORF63 [Anguillid herpesvirus 1]QRM16486.1 protein ORF63 [Anguillid herpesvirus 1]QRM16616.1 protein ORF63 [Anguillid herpesvirus 1]
MDDELPFFSETPGTARGREWHANRLKELCARVGELEEKFEAALLAVETARRNLKTIYHNYGPKQDEQTFDPQNAEQLAKEPDVLSTFLERTAAIKEEFFGAYEWRPVYDLRGKLLGIFPFEPLEDDDPNPRLAEAVENTLLYKGVVLDDRYAGSGARQCAHCCSGGSSTGPAPKEGEPLWKHFLKVHGRRESDLTHARPFHCSDNALNVNFELLRQQCLTSISSTRALSL